jgi:hypothetical protein
VQVLQLVGPRARGPATASRAPDRIDARASSDAGLGTGVANNVAMSSAQPYSADLQVAAPQALPATRPAVDTPWIGTAVALAGLATALAGGIGRRGALDLLPGLDGTFITGVVAMLLLVLHGHRSRFALLVSAPLVGVSALGFFRVHNLPLAPLGLQIAIIGAIAVVTDLLRSRRGAQ